MIILFLHILGCNEKLKAIKFLKSLIDCFYFFGENFILGNNLEKNFISKLSSLVQCAR